MWRWVRGLRHLTVCTVHSTWRPVPSSGVPRGRRWAPRRGHAFSPPPCMAPCAEYGCGPRMVWRVALPPQARCEFGAQRTGRFNGLWRAAGRWSGCDGTPAATSCWAAQRTAWSTCGTGPRGRSCRWADGQVGGWASGRVGGRVGPGQAGVAVGAAGGLVGALAGHAACVHREGEGGHRRPRRPTGCRAVL